MSDISPKQLVMVVLKEGRFVGKMDRADALELNDGGIEGSITLEDACNMHDVITQNGVITLAMYMGTMDIYVGEGETCIVCMVESKTSYFSTYYQSVTNLHLATPKMQ